jgi:hypothetical protein
VLHTQLEYPNIHDKRLQLKQSADDLTWTVNETIEYQKADQLITEAMLHAERNAGRKYSKKFEWSPALKQDIQEFRFRRMKLKVYRKLKVSPKILKQYHQDAKLPEETLETPFTEMYIIQAIRGAYQTLRAKQKDHR